MSGWSAHAAVSRDSATMTLSYRQQHMLWDPCVATTYLLVLQATAAASARDLQTAISSVISSTSGNASFTGERSLLGEIQFCSVASLSHCPATDVCCHRHAWACPPCCSMHCTSSSVTCQQDQGKRPQLPAQLPQQLLKQLRRSWCRFLLQCHLPDQVWYQYAG
jgi:hypothetical protein